MNKKPLLLYALLPLILLGVLCLSPATFAATKTALLSPPTPSRTIALIFYKLHGDRPDFEKALRMSDNFKNADDATKQRMLSSEKSRLANEFANLDVQSQIITVRTAVDIKADVAKAPGLKITMPMANPVYFPYAWGGANIALIPDQVEAFLNIPMDVAEASNAAAKINSNKATLVMEVTPFTTDKKPMMLDGVNQWLLMGKIQTVTYYNQYLQEIWSWKSPNFVRNEPTPLMDLKK